MTENNIVNSNAEVEESAADAATTATTNAPAQTAHDDFDWTIDKRNVAAYNKDEKEKYDKVYDNTFVLITDGELVKGSVVARPRQMRWSTSI
jgi:small subunit ribosomal protein S1